MAIQAIPGQTVQIVIVGPGGGAVHVVISSSGGGGSATIYCVCTWKHLLGNMPRYGAAADGAHLEESLQPSPKGALYAALQLSSLSYSPNP